MSSPDPEMPDLGTAVTVALARDYEIVHRGLARMLEPFIDRVRLVKAGRPAEITLLDPDVEEEPRALPRVLGDPRAGRVVLFGWELDAPSVSRAIAQGAAGYLSKSLKAKELVDALCDIRAGQVVVSESDSEWEDFHVEVARVGLTPRESEVVTLITAGHTNDEIAAQLFVSINSIKSYIRSAYRKMGVTSRAKAVLWGVEHGMLAHVVPLDSQREDHRV